MLTVLVVSGIRLYGEGLAEILDRDSRLEVVGTASAPAEALDLIESRRPDAVLLDLSVSDGERVVRTIREGWPACNVIALGVSSARREVISWAEAGVAGYVFRDDSVDDLVTAVESASQSELRCSSRVAATLLERVATLSARSRPGERDVHLTPREIEVAELLDRGLTNKEIGQRLHIELATVKNHVHNILEKLGVHTRGEAAAAVRALGEPTPRRRGLQL